MKATVQTDRPNAVLAESAASDYWRNDRLVLFAMLLFAALIGAYSAVAFNFDDITAATVLAFAGLLTFLGVIAQMLFGLTTSVRLFYALCALAIYLFLILRGGAEHMGLFGPMAMVPGFVVVLGWRWGGVFLGLMNLITLVIFAGDFYFHPGDAFPQLMEVKFLVSFASLSLFSIACGYSWERSYRKLRADNLRVNNLAYKDALTDLPNRRAIEDLLVQRWEEYKRNGHDFAILRANIDNFRHINSLYGRDFGDGVLVRVANVLVRGLRSQDVISRWGGDDFLIFLPGQTQDTALRVAERIRRRVEDIELAMLREKIPVSISVGVAAVATALGPVDMVSVAEAGLFQAKNLGKNRVMLG